VTNPFVRYSG